MDPVGRMSDLIVAGYRLVGRLQRRRLALARKVRARDIEVAAQREDALLCSAAALRRLGARITRYDAEAGAVEARTAFAHTSALVRLSVTDADGRNSRLRLESDAPDARALFRRFRTELAKLDTRS
jgi:hypothetical protein